MPVEILTQTPPLPPRPNDGHKGTFGRVLIVGGNNEMIGAPVLAGTASLRMGAGLVQIAVPREVLAACLSITPELIGLGLDRRGSTTQLIKAAAVANALVIGPGLGTSPGAKTNLLQLIKLHKPVVIDADGLNILSQQKRWPTGFKSRAVLTPHPGEMRRLARLIGRDDVPNDDAGRVELAVAAAQAFKQTVVLKGHRTVVTDGHRAYVNTTGDSSLSKAGTGDVLSGIIGTLLAQQMSPFDSAATATWLHGRAGELAGRELGPRSVLARDVLTHLPRAVAEYPQ